MKTDYDYFFKFVLIGDTCCGKSCLLVRFAVSTYKLFVINVCNECCRMMISKRTTLQPLELILDSELYKSIKVQSDCKSGIQQDRKDTELLLKHITKELMEFLLSLI